MRRGWINRSVFIGLLLLCVGGWVWSYAYDWDIHYMGHIHHWYMQCVWGKVYLVWTDQGRVGEWVTEGLHVEASPLDAGVDAQFVDSFDSPHCLGFFIHNDQYDKFLIIPFYFPTLISAALLWFVWRKTRPKTKGRAFPVEIAAKQKQP